MELYVKSIEKYVSTKKPTIRDKNKKNILKN